MSASRNLTLPHEHVLQHHLLDSLFPATAVTADAANRNDIQRCNGNPKVSSDNYTKVNDPEEPKSKRRQKVQKPGKTAKMNDRHFVVHKYTDRANEPENVHRTQTNAESKWRGGVTASFPLKLHAILDQAEADGLAHIISWQPHGRCFKIHKPKEFVEHVMPGYFRQTKLTSFQRQLNIYGFCRLTKGPDSSGYYHELFLRGRTSLCTEMVRTKVKGTKFKAASSPDQEPDFYAMLPVVRSVNHSNIKTTVSSLDKTKAAPSTPSFSHEQISDLVNLKQQAQILEQMQLSRFTASAPSFLVDTLNPQLNLHQQAKFWGQMHAPYARMGPMTIPPLCQEGLVIPILYSDRVLDEAVDEVFCEDGSKDNLIDFRAWNLSNKFLDDSDIDDEQFGLMLERMLDEE